MTRWRRQSSWCRKQTWRAFLDAHAKTILAADFSMSVFLRRLYVLFFIEHGTWQVHLVGITAHPTGERVTQQARNLLMNLDDRVDGFKFLIHDRDAKFTAAFDAVFTAVGARIIKTPVRAGERLCRTLGAHSTGRGHRPDADRRAEAPHMVLDQYAVHYNEHRPHRAQNPRPPVAAEITPAVIADLTTPEIRRRRVLGGLLNEYERAA